MLSFIAQVSFREVATYYEKLEHPNLFRDASPNRSGGPSQKFRIEFNTLVATGGYPGSESEATRGVAGYRATVKVDAVAPILFDVHWLVVAGRQGVD
jgi:hypothetical protein